MSKKLDTSAIQNELSGVASFYRASHPSKKSTPKPNKDIAHKVAQNNEQTVEQMSKPLSKNLQKSVLKPFKSEDIELLAFQLRKVRKVKVNTEVPDEWKDKLDTLAYQLKVGKYDLLMYIIGLFLEEVKPEPTK